MDSLIPLRILYLVPDMFGSPGGIARHGHTVCRALTSSFDVSVVALHDQREAHQEAAKAFPQMEYEACSSNRLKFVTKALRGLRQRPSLILIEHPNFSHLGWLLARLRRVPCVVITHGVDIWTPLSPLRRKAITWAERVICVSHFSAKRAREANGIAEERIRVLHNCLDPDYKKIKTERGKASHPSLLTVSRILRSEEYKGHDLVIRALPTVLERFPNLIYNIVGDGDGRSQMETLAKQQKVSHAVRFHGVVPDETLANFYANTSLFVMPSRREGFGLVFLEAMAQGIPVIGGSEDATPEVIQDGESGLIVNPTSVEAVAAAISRLLSDDNLRQEMGVKGVQATEGKFGFSNFRVTLIAHLKEVLDERRNTTAMNGPCNNS